MQVRWKSEAPLENATAEQLAFGILVLTRSAVLQIRVGSQDTCRQYQRGPRSPNKYCFLVHTLPTGKHGDYQYCSPSHEFLGHIIIETYCPLMNGGVQEIVSGTSQIRRFPFTILFQSFPARYTIGGVGRTRSFHSSCTPNKTLTMTIRSVNDCFSPWLSCQRPTMSGHQGVHRFMHLDGAPCFTIGIWIVDHVLETNS